MNLYGKILILPLFLFFEVTGMSLDVSFDGVEIYKNGKKIGSIYCKGLGYDEYGDTVRIFKVTGKIKEVKDGDTEEVIKIML